MSGFDNNMTGILFHTQEKRTDKSPDNYGSITIDNVEYSLSGWVKTNARGEFLSLRATRKDGEASRPAPCKTGFGTSRQEPKPKQDPAPNYSGMEDDIPF